MSQTRSSRVGYLALGRMSHQILVASSHRPVRSSRCSMCRHSSALAKYSGRPLRGRSPKMVGRYALSPVGWPCQNGDERRQRQQVRQEVGRLVHQVDPSSSSSMPAWTCMPQITRREASVCMSRASTLVALLVDLLLRAPVGERMGRGGDHRHAELARGRGDASRAARSAAPARRPRSAHTVVPTSTCACSSSWVTRSPSRSWQRCMKPCGRRGDEVAARRDRPGGTPPRARASATAR